MSQTESPDLCPPLTVTGNIKSHKEGICADFLRVLFSMCSLHSVQIPSRLFVNHV